MEQLTKASRCTDPPVPGMVRIFLSAGAAPQLFDRDWSTSGHAWSVLDIPAPFLEEIQKAQAEYLRTQALLRKYVENAKKFCNCGSDHADLPIEYD